MTGSHAKRPDRAPARRRRGRAGVGTAGDDVRAAVDPRVPPELGREEPVRHGRRPAGRAEDRRADLVRGRGGAEQPGDGQPRRGSRGRAAVQARSSIRPASSSSGQCRRYSGQRGLLTEQERRRVDQHGRRPRPGVGVPGGAGSSSTAAARRPREVIRRAPGPGLDHRRQDAELDQAVAEAEHLRPPAAGPLTASPASLQSQCQGPIRSHLGPREGPLAQAPPGRASRRTPRGPVPAVGRGPQPTGCRSPPPPILVRPAPERRADWSRSSTVVEADASSAAAAAE